MRISEELHTVMVLTASFQEKKLVTHYLGEAKMWWDVDKMVIPDLDSDQLKVVEKMLDELNLPYLIGPTTDGR